GEDVAHLDEAQRSGGPGQISRSAAAWEDVVGGHVVAAAGQGHPAGEEVVDDGGVLDRGVDGAGLIAAEAAVDVVVVDAVIVLVHADAGTGAEDEVAVNGVVLAGANGDVAVVLADGMVAE